MLEKEYEYYQNNKDSLVKEHKGQFIVIKGNEVIGVYLSREEALKETAKTNKLGTFLIQEVTEKEGEEIQRFFSRVYV